MGDGRDAWSIENLLSALPCDLTEVARALVDRPNVAAALTDLEGRLLYRNAAYYTALGYEPGEAMDVWGVERSHPDDVAHIRDSVRRVAEEGYASGEYRVRHRDGRWVWHYAGGVLLRGCRGKPSVLLFIIRDISARKAAEEALRHSEERLRLLVESADDVILMVDLAGRVAWSSVPSRYGLTSELLQGRCAAEMFPAGQAAQLQADEAVVRETGESRTCEHHLTLAGQELWFNDLIYPVRDPAGRVTHIGWMCRNITTLKAAQSALEKERETARRYLDIASVMITAIDVSGRVMMINRKGAAILGLPQEEIVGKDWVSTFIPERWRDRVREARRGVMEGSRPPGSTFTNPVLGAGGEERLIEWRAGARLDEGGNVVGTLSSGEDVTERNRAEEALRRSEARYRGIVEDQIDWIARYDVDRRITFVNDALCRRHGMSVEEILGRSLLDFVRPGTQQDVEKFVASLTPAHPVGVQEVTGTDAEGRSFYQQWIHRAILDAEGKVVEYQAVGRDLSALRRAQEQLEQSEARYRGIVEDQIDFICRFGADGGLLFANEPLKQLVGLPDEQLIGRNFYDFLSPEDREGVRRGIESLTRERPVGTNEHPARVRGEEVRWLQWTNRAICDPQGRVIEYQAVGRDVTERVRAEQARREGEARYRAIVEQQTDFIARYRLDGVVTYVNPAICRALGMSAGDVVGRRVYEFLRPEDREAARARLATAGPEHPQADSEYAVTLPDGGTVWTHWVHHVIVDDQGRVAEVQSVGRDVTDRKHAQELIVEKSRMETASTMAGGIAHDFNNLMVAVLGNAELLRSEVLGNTDALEMLDSVSRSARRAADLAQKLLAFARGGKYRPTTVDLNDVVRETLQMQGRVVPSGVRVDLELADDLAKISADRTQMSQVVMNLLLNAVEAVGPRGRVVVSTWNGSASRDSRTRGDEVQAGPHACLSVRDNGPGMDAETVARMFQPFFTTKGPGRGMGLPAVFGIVKNHGGDIGVESVPGRGTTFTICLPATAEPARPPARKTRGSPRGRQTILIVDDEESVITVTRRMLERLGYRVLTAASGPEGIRLAKEHRGGIHVALLDIGMPGMDGAEAFPLLAAARPSMRIIIASGYDLDQMSRGLVEAGARGFIQKPFVSEELAREIRAALDAD